ncbi:MAG: redox-sensing transcriptional repressor Rex [Lachnospiraceae bacterium]|nr:redox-sensing transcriptional repressor Rex [Lachnospiraceae bacterium]
MERKEISKAVITRLPRYYRYLGELLEEGVERISSNDLSIRMKVTASQIRQDLNNFGGFGQQGYGYNVKYLYTEIAKILGIDRQHNLIIIGSGNLGQAIANYANFERRGFIVKGMFDVNPRLIGLVVRGIEIRGVEELEKFIVEHEVQIAALTIPKTKAPEIADRLVKAGIKAIWNFAHVDLAVPDDVVVENVHLSESLMRLSYRVSSMQDEEMEKRGKGQEKP